MSRVGLPFKHRKGLVCMSRYLLSSLLRYPSLLSRRHSQTLGTILYADARVFIRVRDGLFLDVLWSSELMFSKKPQPRWLGRVPGRYPHVLLRRRLHPEGQQHF